MAKTLQEILSPGSVAVLIKKYAQKVGYRPFSFVDAPTHHLENVPGEPGMVRCACNKWKWRRNDNKPFDESKLMPHLVTCKDCLATMCRRADDVRPDVVVQEQT